MQRSDEQLAYYVAQAREIIDLSLLAQKQMVDRPAAAGPAPAGRRGGLMQPHSQALDPGLADLVDPGAGADLALATEVQSDAGDGDDHGNDVGAPVWPVFGDLMAGLLGAFVLMLVLLLGVQLELASSQLQAEVQRRQAEQQRRQTLEQALAGAAGQRPGDAGGRPHRHQRQRAVRAEFRPAAARRPARC